MRAMAILILASACSHPMDGGGGGGILGGGDDVSGGGDDAAAVDAGLPDAPLAHCDPSDWTIAKGFDTWTSDFLAALIWPEIRTSATGIEVAYAMNENQGFQKRVATRDAGGAWTIATSGAHVQSNYARGVDSHGNEHACWSETPQYDGSTAPISCGWRPPGGAAWTMTSIDPSGTLSNISLAIDKTDRVVITYNATNFAGGSKYAIRDPATGTWTTQLLGSVGYTFAPLAVDHEDCVHVAARFLTSGSLTPFEVRHGTMCAGATTWTWEHVTSSAQDAFLNSGALAIDALDRVDLVFDLSQGNATGTRFAGVLQLWRRDAAGWTSQDVDGATLVTDYSESVAADLDGGVFVAYMPSTGEFTASEVVTHIAASGTKTRSAIGTSLYGGTSASLVDASGRAHVVFSRDNTALDYATSCD